MNGDTTADASQRLTTADDTEPHRSLQTAEKAATGDYPDSYGQRAPTREITHGQRQPLKERTTRRSVLRTLTVGGSVIAGTVLAGCLSGGSGGTSRTEDSNEASSVEDWLTDTDNYESVQDMTDKTSVTVEVGTEGNNGANAFAPAAIEVSPGTTVTWKWVDGYHNVVATDGQFTSGEPAQNATFEHTFETAGTVLYYCEPHKLMGMKGAVIISGGDTEGSGNTSNQSEAQ